MTELSSLEPDFEGLVSQLRTSLQTRDAWKDLYESGTGQTLIEYNAAIGTFLHFALERAVQEVFMSTASLDTSIYTNSRMMGVNPTRKVSAKTTVNLSLQNTLTTSVNIPAMSQFDINGTPFYNPSIITFPANTQSLSNIPLEQGQIQTMQFSGNSQPFQSFEFSRNFEANENLLQVMIDNTVYRRERNSLWSVPVNQTAFLELVLPDGSIRIVFGNSSFATIPTSGQNINVAYAISIGTEANTASSGLSANLLSNIEIGGESLDISGTTATGISGGKEQESAEVVKYTSPRLFAAGNRAIRRDDWKAIVVKHTGVDIVDANATGEFEANSQDNTLMNNVELTLLLRNSNNFNFTLGMGNGTLTNFSGNIPSIPVERGSVRIVNNTTNEIFQDNGNNVLTSNLSRLNERQSISIVSGKNEVQRAYLTSGTTSGTFRITVNTNNTTAPIPYNASALDLEMALENISIVNNVSVTGLGTSSDPWIITFLDPGKTNLSLSADSTALLPNTSRLMIETVTEGQPASPFTLTFKGQTTASIPFDATSVLIKDRLDSLSTIDSVNVVRISENLILVTFDGVNTGGVNQPLMTIAFTNPTGSTGTVFENNPGGVPGSGTINYETGALSVTFGTAPVEDVNVIANYSTDEVTTTQRENIIEYLEDFKHVTTLVTIVTPVAIVVDIVATIYYLSGHNLETVRNNINAEIDKIFERRIGLLGASLEISDILCDFNNVTGVDYTLLESPAARISAGHNQYISLGRRDISVVESNR